MTVYLVRHAHAGSRKRWSEDDADRPLSDRGRDQAAGLVPLFGDEAIGRVLSSPSLRCQQTVAPVARHRGLEVEVEQHLDEGTDVDDAVALVEKLAGDGDVMLCSHGDVVPEVIDALAERGMEVDGDAHSAKGGTFVIRTDGRAFLSATYVPPPGG